LQVLQGIAVGSSDEVAASVDVMIEDGLGIALIVAPAPFGAEGHGSQTKRADLEAGTAKGEVRIEIHAEI
jgi:hypothetical protein